MISCTSLGVLHYYPDYPKRSAKVAKPAKNAIIATASQGYASVGIPALNGYGDCDCLLTVGGVYTVDVGGSSPSSPTGSSSCARACFSCRKNQLPRQTREGTKDEVMVWGGLEQERTE